MKDQVILVPLSGGLDSTLVAYKTLCDGYTILPVYITMNNVNISKATIELQQSKKIHSLLLQEFGVQVLPLKNLKVSIRGRNQFEIWVYSLAQKIDLELIHQVHFGPTKSDLDEYTTMEDVLSRLDFAKTTLNKDVRFPILDYTKTQISKILPHQYQKETYTCELPLYHKSGTKIWVKQCGKCNACHLHKMSSLALSGPFKLQKTISDNDIEENNLEHKKYIHISNNYNQQTVTQAI